MISYTHVLAGPDNLQTSKIELDSCDHRFTGTTCFSIGSRLEWSSCSSRTPTFMREYGRWNDIIKHDLITAQGTQTLAKTYSTVGKLFQELPGA